MGLGHRKGRRFSYPGDLLARPFIIGPHGRLGFLKGGTLEEKIYRRTDRPGIGRSRGWNDGSGRVSQTQRF